MGTEEEPCGIREERPGRGAARGRERALAGADLDPSSEKDRKEWKAEQLGLLSREEHRARLSVLWAAAGGRGMSWPRW